MKKLSLKRRSQKEALPNRITNETVAEHRERILAGGRRFKYPMQYARHRLVVVTVTLAVAAVALIGIFGWWQLYVAQSTSTMLYRVTQIIPVPVASVDGQKVRYSDYLMYYNSSIHFLQKSEQLVLSDKDGQRQVADQKRKNLDIAIRNAYAEKLAKQLDIKVEPDQLKRVNEDHLTMANGPISQETYNASTMSLLGWTPEEEQRATKNQLLRSNVAYAIDDKARQQVEKVSRLLQTPDADFDKVASEVGDPKVTAYVTGMVPLVNNDGGLAEAARKLEKGHVSSVIRSTTGDGYYFVKLIEKTDTQLNYACISIPLTEFDRRLEALRQAGKVHEYINVPEENATKVKK